MTHTSTDQYREQFNVQSENLSDRVKEVNHEGFYTFEDAGHSVVCR